jgi:hypothetical protein
MKELSHSLGRPLTPVPRLSLSHGQVAWALARGTPPSRQLLDQLRYLRQLGVPFMAGELGTGRGYRVRYAFDHLIELGVALFGLRRGMTPRDITSLVVASRAQLRRIYRAAFAAQPLLAIEQPWVKSRGAEVPILADEVFLRLNDRHSGAPGTFEIVRIKDLNQIIQMAMAGEGYPGEATRTLLPLTRLVLELVAWAREAPETRPGRK